MHNYVKHDIGRDEFHKIHRDLQVVDISVSPRAEVKFYDGLSPHVQVFVLLNFGHFTYLDKYGIQMVRDVSEITDPSRFSAGFRMDFYLDTRFGETRPHSAMYLASHGKEDYQSIITLGEVWTASEEDLKAGGNEKPSDRGSFSESPLGNRTPIAINYQFLWG